MTLDALNLRKRADAALALVAEVTGVPVERFAKRARREDLLAARRLAMWILKVVLKMSYPQIAEICNMRDHASALLSVQLVSRSLQDDAELREFCVQVARQLDPGFRLSDEDLAAMTANRPRKGTPWDVPRPLRNGAWHEGAELRPKDAVRRR